ncbi:MAG: hypothetical protein ACLGG0_06405 [Bacteriovoracia bacterium]
MKKILLLVGILGLLLTLTWVLTESGWMDKKSNLEKVMAKSLQNPQKFNLPAAELTMSEGVWRTGSGEIARAEVLEELHRSLESLTIARVISDAPDRNEFFGEGLKFSVDDQTFEWGSMAPSGDSFFLGLVGDPNVYVVDLRAMGSFAMADEEKVLLQSKYQRLRDLLLYPEDRWREERLLPLLQFAQFLNWEKGELKLDSLVLSKRPWGKAAMNAFLAGLQSLKVKGNILNQAPLKKSKIQPWFFTLHNGAKISWEFYEHPNLDLIYVWLPHLKKAYPLDQESSEFIGRFPERLVSKSFSMVLGEPGVKPEIVENKQQVTVESEASKALTRFMQTAQTFEILSLITGKDCQELARTSVIQLKTQGIEYAWRRVSSGWAILDCETGLTWTWSLPLESPMDFATLLKP